MGAVFTRSKATAAKNGWKPANVRGPFRVWAGGSHGWRGENMEHDLALGRWVLHGGTRKRWGVVRCIQCRSDSECV